MPPRKRAARQKAPAVEQQPEEEVAEEQTEDNVEEAEAENEDEVMVEGLRFDKPLTWRAGKPIAVSELLQRLQQLSEELVSMDQEYADRATLEPKAQELASAQLLAHRDKGVRAWAMLCIVEMFRLLAPDAPYKAGQLKTIFDLFASSIVPALASPSDPYNQQHTSIIQSLTSFKSIVLVTDIPGSDPLILKLFTNCFDVLSGNAQGGHGETIPRNVEYHMTKMLVTIVEECDSLPPEVPDVILAQFLRVDPHALTPANKKTETQASEVIIEPSPAYNMARSICNTCANKMGPLVGSYFSSVLVDVSQNFTTSKSTKTKSKKRTYDESEDEDDSRLTPPAEVDLEEIEKAHRLLRELWRSSPDVIHNVIEHLDIELSTENVSLRVLAVQTVGDMIAGIGSAGPPLTIPIDPAAYPAQSVHHAGIAAAIQNVMLTARAPHAFSSIYHSTYQAFFSRHADRAASVRSAWATAVGRILMTSGGGKGLDQDQETDYLRCFSQRLVDSDEKVRLAAVQAISAFDFASVVNKLGKSGGITKPDSILCNLAERIKDRNASTRTVAMESLGRIWGAAAGAIAEGDEHIRGLLASAPSNILLAMYLNKPEINALVQQVLWESLLPIGYPPIKAKANGVSQRVPDSQAEPETSPDPDMIRTERILVLVRDLQDKARSVFFSILGQQGLRAKYLEHFLKECEAYAGGSCSSEDKASIKSRLDRLSEALAKFAPDPSTAAEHLLAFAKAHDRRCYQLLRFAYAPDSNYKKVTNALKELRKRLEEGSAAVVAASDTVVSLAQTSAKLVYNKSHVPAIMEYMRTDQQDLGGAAHEVLKELSVRDPDVFKGHVLELCNALKKQAPSATTSNDAATVDTLKACAGFAKRFPQEMPDDRDFYRAMVGYAKYARQPKAAKHALTIIVAAAEKKEMYVKELIEFCIQDFRPDGEHVVPKLATLAQIQLVASKDIESHGDTILDIAVAKVLKRPLTLEESGLDWKFEIEDELMCKLLALKILVNGVRGLDSSGEVSEAYERVKPKAERVYQLLNTLIDREGELSPSKTTPNFVKARLRLTAATQLLKLSCNPILDRFLRQTDFNDLTRTAQDARPEVRHAFLSTLKKYLVQGKLPPRFYSLVFIYAFEPSKTVKDSVVTWLRGRGAVFAKEDLKVMESVFPRFLSVLAHHQDFSPEVQDVEEFVEYITFFLRSVATEENIAVLHHVAQRLKTVEDGIDPSKSRNLYILSDVAEAIIRHYCDIRGWSLQLYSGRLPLPSGIFARLPGHVAAQEVSETQYAPEELMEKLEDLVKQILRPKKRKADAGGERPAKKVKSSMPTLSKKKATPVKPKKKKDKKTATSNATSSVDRRRSSRVSKSKNYAEDSDSPIDEDDVDDSDDAASDVADESDAEEVEENDESDAEADGEEVQPQQAEANKENVSEEPPSPELPSRSNTKSRTRTSRSAASVKAPAKKANPPAPTRSRPQRSGRSTRNQKAKESEHSDSELSDAPEEE